MNRGGESQKNSHKTYLHICTCLLCILFLLFTCACGSNKGDKNSKENKEETVTKVEQVKDKNPAPVQKHEVPEQTMWPYLNWEAYNLGKTADEVSFGTGNWLDVTGSANVEGCRIKVNDGSNGIRYFCLFKYGGISEEIYGFKNNRVVAFMDYVQTRQMTVEKVLEHYGFTLQKGYAHADIIESDSTNREYTARWRVKNGYLAISYTTYDGMSNYLQGYAWKILVANDYNISYLFDGINKGNKVINNVTNSLEDANMELNRYGKFGNLTQITSKGGGNGWLGKLDNGDIAVFDKGSGRVAIISSNDVVESVSREVSKGNGYGIVRASFQIYNDSHDNDEANGSWHGNVHILPVQMEYQVQNSKVVPGMLKSGSSAEPSVYDNYLYEQKNVDMVNLFLKNVAYLN